jgi:plasmid replication initiation protein
MEEVKLYQSNVLTESRYNVNRIQKNCLYKIIEKVRQDYIENQKDRYENLHVTLPPSVLEDITDKKHKQDAHDALVALRKRDVEIHYEDGSWLNCGFINWAKWNTKENLYKIEVSSEIMPFLVDLARQYTSYSLTVAMSLKSVYSQRFYELCCQYRNRIENDGIPGFHKTQQQLREMFCLEDKYPLNADFNKRVIQKAQTELKTMYDAKQCDLYFNVNIKGRGKDMCYDFKICTREKSVQQQEAFNDTRKKWLYIQGQMTNIFKKDTKLVQRISKTLDFNPNLIEPVFTKLQRLEKEYKGAELAKILRYVLKNDFEII